MTGNARSKVLVTGGSGLLGSALVRSAPGDVAVEVTRRSAPSPSGVRSHRIDLTQPLACFELLERRRPDVVIHTAYDNADGAATVDAATEVASACAALDVELVHISTDALFDGEHAPYDEAAEPSPIHPYGRSKAMAEVAVLASVPDAAIVRTSLIVAADGTDPTTASTIDALRAGGRVTFFSDEVRWPILVDDLAVQLWELVGLDRGDRAGVWHLVGPQALTRAQLGAILCAAFALDTTLVDEAPSSSVPGPRPRDVTLTSVRAGSLVARPRTVGSVLGHGQAHR